MSDPIPPNLPNQNLPPVKNVTPDSTKNFLFLSKLPSFTGHEEEMFKIHEQAMRGRKLDDSEKKFLSGMNTAQLYDNNGNLDKICTTADVVAEVEKRIQSNVSAMTELRLPKGEYQRTAAEVKVLQAGLEALSPSPAIPTDADLHKEQLAALFVTTAYGAQAWVGEPEFDTDFKTLMQSSAFNSLAMAKTVFETHT
jgi:hypothetical protein